MNKEGNIEVSTRNGKTFWISPELKEIIQKMNKSGINILEINLGKEKNFEDGYIMLDWNARPSIVKRAVKIVTESKIKIPVISWELRCHTGRIRKEMINE